MRKSISGFLAKISGRSGKRPVKNPAARAARLKQTRIVTKVPLKVQHNIGKRRVLPRNIRFHAKRALPHKLSGGRLSGCKLG
ncbi:hypothetical protein HMPREF9123_1248 [Neisseria bacilliformis ATCC BAA-1200]|uniref:Uncharacterized protein n=1 Tax=Neisseria bacilliformis ATCC BAA-1200 TaxID=888742 RepID=F2BBZ3_9NEIS|nr:hypothetical protein HMPREF9123_1248 [Neisseria bacilliformis ATCC BAA-1200]